MSASLKWKLAVGFALVFLAGFATGGFFTATRTRHLGLEFAHHHSLVERMRTRLHSQLQLTPDQTAKAEPIVEKTARELENIRTETNQRVQQTLTEADRALAPVLTAEQRARLQKIRERKGPRHGPRALDRDESNPAD